MGGRRECMRKKRRKERGKKGKQANATGKNTQSMNYTIGITQQQWWAKITIFLKIILWGVLLPPV